MFRGLLYVELLKSPLAILESRQLPGLFPVSWRTDFVHHRKLRVYVIMKALSDKSIFFLVKRR